jgi:alkanesulfonate monooxygenase SsuD/methylene tetrahydromethanopterin reductase-like flavin-dependent oxidoreductase (luciferase family)
MHYGIEVVPFGAYSNPRYVVELAQAAETAGWNGIWIWDHVLFPYGAGDPWISLAAVAAATRHLKLVTGISPLPRYRPHLLARMLAGLDLLSEGRVIFGTGSGVDWDFKPFGEAGEVRIRAAMLDEGLDLLVKLLAGEKITHQGKYYTAEEVQMAPAALQKPRIPVWIGGDSPAALRRAAKWDGWIMGTINEACQVTKTPAQIAEQVAYIRSQRPEPGVFDVAIDGASQPGENTLAGEYEAAGATWWFEGIFGSRGSHEEMLQRIMAGPPV